MPHRRSSADRARGIRSSPSRSARAARRRAAGWAKWPCLDSRSVARVSVAAMASAPPVTTIDLTEFAEIVDNARTDGDRGQSTGVVATSNEGQPDVALKGSLMVWDADHLAWWERGRAETEAAVRANPRVAVMVRNLTRDRRTLRFYGEARIVDDAELRERIWGRVLQVEKDTDPEKLGVAVLVRVDRVRAGKFDIQRR